MTLHVLGSSSKGNGYILESDTEALIIEAGIKMKEVKKALNWNIRKVVGAIVTHEHNDHAGHIQEVVDAGIVVLALADVFKKKGLTDRPFTKVITPGKGYKLGSFRIQPIHVKHDVPCVGYIIQHPDMGKLLFITDTITLGCLVPGLTQIMIEANYDDEIIDRNVASGRINPAMRSRVLNAHMGFNETKAILKENDLTQVDNIVLIHLSDGNANEQKFVTEVQELTGKPTYAARPGMKLNLSKTPY